MSRVVGYFENNNEEMYAEGPYVLCAGPLRQGFRIEKRGPTCSTLVDVWVYDYRRLMGIEEGWQPSLILAPIVDTLNWAHLYCEFLKGR